MTPAARRGVPLLLGGVLLAGALSGCGSADDSSATTASPSTSASSPTSTSTTSAAPSTTTTAHVATIDVIVRGKQVTPSPARVEIKTGERLRLVVTVDHDDELHAHGFDVERELKAGKPTTIELTGGEPGLYEVETHHPELRLMQILVR